MDIVEEKAPASICAMRIEPIIEEESMSEDDSFSSSAAMSSESEMYQKELRDKIIPMANERRVSICVSSKE